MFEIVGGIIVFTIMLLLSGLKVVNEYDRLVVFRFGKAIEVKGTGVQLVVPLIDRVQVVDMRLVTMPVEFVEEDTLDNQTVRVSALCLFRVADPKKMVTKIDFENDSSHLHQAISPEFSNG
jgi:regulator of protease activity HflC (stomatin/prohibitin superfamily)